MTQELVIVESPAKAKTISKYLDKQFTVLASFGHVRDLPKKPGSIDVEHNFTPHYQLIAKNKVHIEEIIAAAKASNIIYLASDQDREGEAIAWHIQEILQDNLALLRRKIVRITFNEITKTAILEALAKPRDIDFNLVDAQQARLTLDYLIGFTISPLLWRKIKPKLSAGRVQSPALRLICEREEEIKRFVPEAYFSLHLLSHKEDIKFNAKLIEYAAEKFTLKSITEHSYAQQILTNLQEYSQAQVIKIIKKQKHKHPTAPFITSTLQIEAAKRLGFTAERAMRIAQNLYEGIELQKETIGMITYMRTDSVHLSTLACDEIRNYITHKFAISYLPAQANVYINKAKNAQEAHEAIRPTSIWRTPAEVKNYLNAEQFKLYELIWQRTLACQLAPAILDTTAIDVQLGKGIFRANGVRVNFDGFMCVYDEVTEDGTAIDSSSPVYLPELVNDEFVPVDQLEIGTHHTEPKPRYSEALLVKALEELGIGRPSTYASILATLRKREYVVMDKKRFIPTEIGTMVNQFLTQHLPKYVDLQFTANLEDLLDNIALGRYGKLPLLTQFWQELQAVIATKQNISKFELTTEALDEACPECQKPLIIKFGKYGRFIGCSGYPECHYMRKLDNGEATANSPEIIPERYCPQDGGQLILRSGKYGKFIACANYPQCKYLENLSPVNLEQALTCPACQAGKIIPKKGRFGAFYGCNHYPNCKTIFKYLPIAKECPNCQYALMMEHSTKTKGTIYICPQCKYNQQTLIANAALA